MTPKQKKQIFDYNIGDYCGKERSIDELYASYWQLRSAGRIQAALEELHTAVRTHDLSSTLELASFWETTPEIHPDEQYRLDYAKHIYKRLIQRNNLPKDIASEAYLGLSRIYEHEKRYMDSLANLITAKNHDLFIPDDDWRRCKSLFEHLDLDKAISEDPSACLNLGIALLNAKSNQAEFFLKKLKDCKDENISICACSALINFYEMKERVDDTLNYTLLCFEKLLQSSDEDGKSEIYVIDSDDIFDV